MMKCALTKQPDGRLPYDAQVFWIADLVGPKTSVQIVGLADLDRAICAGLDEVHPAAITPRAAYRDHETVVRKWSADA